MKVLVVVVTTSGKGSDGSVEDGVVADDGSMLRQLLGADRSELARGRAATHTTNDVLFRPLAFSRVTLASFRSTLFFIPAGQND